MTLKDFLNNKDNFINDAIVFGATCPIKKIELTTNISSIENLDELTEILNDLYKKGMITDVVSWNIAVNMGVLLGEMIINKENYKWVINEDNLPVVEAKDGNQLSPIAKIYKIIRSVDDTEGRPSDFYSTFIELENFNNLSKEEQDNLTTYMNE